MKHKYLLVSILFSFSMVAQQVTNIGFDEKQFSNLSAKDPGFIPNKLASEAVKSNSSSVYWVEPRISTNYMAPAKDNLDDRSLSDWCGTMPHWERTNPGQRSCNQFGPVDDPSVRDSYIPYSDDAITTREELGGRWLSTEFKMGDVLIFSIYTIHASTDNISENLRFSCDSRYQLASEPVDERWVGPNPIRHQVQGFRCSMV